MKSLLVLASSTGGIGWHVAGIVKRLVEVGEDVIVCGPEETDRLFGYADRGARFIAVEIPPNLHPSDMRAVRVLRHVVAHEEPAVIHAHGLRAGLASALTRPACPLVVTWHNAPLRAGLRGRMHTLVERIVGRAADVTLCASSDLVIRARAVGAKDVRLAEVASPPLRRSRRSRAAIRGGLGIADGAVVALSVGRLHPQKGYPTLVAAAARWRDIEPTPRILIAGEGPSYLDLAAQISESRAPVTLLGQRNDVGDLLAASDLAIVTSLWEARQLFAQEAMLAGVPLIATEVGGIPELVGEGAELIPPSDPDALDKIFRRLATEPQAREQLVQRGTRQAAGWPDEAATVAHLREIYAEVIARRRK